MDPEFGGSSRAVRAIRRGGVVTTEGIVYLVGAGPGDPELLTLKALRILGQADVVLHDDLLTPKILELIPSTARIECVGKRHNERQVTQEEINRRLCEYASRADRRAPERRRQGNLRPRERRDGRASRRRHFITIVPGVTAASGAAAAAGVR